MYVFHFSSFLREPQNSSAGDCRSDKFPVLLFRLQCGHNCGIPIPLLHFWQILLPSPHSLRVHDTVLSICCRCQILCRIADSLKFFKPHFCMFFLIVCRLQKQICNLLISFLFGNRSKTSVQKFQKFFCLFLKHLFTIHLHRLAFRKKQNHASCIGVSYSSNSLSVFFRSGAAG